MSEKLLENQMLEDGTTKTQSTNPSKVYLKQSTIHVEMFNKVGVREMVHFLVFKDEGCK